MNLMDLTLKMELQLGIIQTGEMIFLRQEYSC